MNAVDHLVSEAAAMEILELEERVRDLEADNAVLVEIATAGIHQLHAAHLREQKLKKITLSQRLEIQMLRDHSECGRDAEDGNSGYPFTIPGEPGPDLHA